MVGILSCLDASGLEMLGAGGGGFCVASAFVLTLISLIQYRKIVNCRTHARKDVNAPRAGKVMDASKEVNLMIAAYLTTPEQAQLLLTNKKWKQTLEKSTYEKALLYGYTGEANNWKEGTKFIQQLTKETIQLWSKGLIPSRFIVLRQISPSHLERSDLHIPTRLDVEKVWYNLVIQQHLSQALKFLKYIRKLTETIESTI